MEYRRIWHQGGTYFFTVNLLNRQNDLLVRHIQILREAIQKVKTKYPFKIHAWVVLPEHMHCVLELPLNDADYALRWRLIKSTFSKVIDKTEYRSSVRLQRNERGIWQRRYWAHLIVDDADYRAHMDYVHINPLKHGLVKRVQDWEFSSFHSLVGKGVYPIDWAGGSNDHLYSDKDWL
ncbi:MAG: transposase [Methylotenera sp.]|nr:transposase [Methylotenera sp.]